MPPLVTKAKLLNMFSRNQIYTAFAFLGLLGLPANAQTLPNSIAYLEPLAETETDGGPGCGVIGTNGRYLIDTKVKIGGQIIPIKLLSLTRKAKTWVAPDLKIFFQVNSGVLKQTSDGYQSGASEWGILRISYKGQQADMRAREACDDS
jgi:hypothetical protein